MNIGYIGLGKMGLAQVERLLKKRWRVVAWNRSAGPRNKAKKAGAEVSGTLEGVCTKLKTPRLIWLMVPHTAVDDVLRELAPHLTEGDTVIDGGNSFYKDSIRRAEELAHKSISFLDVGVSGGPSGARNGACLMIGGERRIFKKYEHLFLDLSALFTNFKTKREHTNKLENVGMSLKKEPVRETLARSYAYVGKAGAGHFVKMVHNGIEYGMMQAIAEGFVVLRKSQFKLNLKQVAELYNQGSVIESRLLGWLGQAFAEHGENLKNVSGEVAHTGEGEWTVRAAKEFGVPVPIIESAFQFRVASEKNPSYIGRVLSALRNQFGGHDVSKG